MPDREIAKIVSSKDRMDQLAEVSEKTFKSDHHLSVYGAPFRIPQINLAAVEIAKVFHQAIMVCVINYSIFVCTKIQDYTAEHATYVPIGALLCKGWETKGVIEHFFHQIRGVCNMTKTKYVILMNPSNPVLAEACTIFSHIVVPGFWEVLVELRKGFTRVDKVSLVGLACKLKQHFVDLEIQGNPYDVAVEADRTVYHDIRGTVDMEKLVSLLIIWRERVPQAVIHCGLASEILFTHEDMVSSLEYTAFLPVARVISYFNVLSCATARYVRNLMPYDFDLL